MADFIIYQDEEGRLGLVCPTDDLPIEDIANRDLPTGVPYKLINRSDLPLDNNFMDSWEYDFSDPDGYALGLDAWIAEQ